MEAPSRGSIIIDVNCNGLSRQKNPRQSMTEFVKQNDEWVCYECKRNNKQYDIQEVFQIVADLKEAKESVDAMIRSFAHTQEWK